jgi:hypothetical protein
VYGETCTQPIGFIDKNTVDVDNVVVTNPLSIHVFPNPTADNLNVFMNHSEQEDKIHIYDLNGGEIPSLFEKRSILTVEKYGQYKAEARNRIFNSLTKSSSEVATFKTPDPIVMDNKDQTTNKHIIGTDSAVLAPQVVKAVGDLSYQWYRADEDAEKIYKYRVVDVPTGTKISYGNDHIRMMVPADTDFKK